MEYRYNAERDRLDRFAYNSSYLKAIYRNQSEERTGYFWICTSNWKNVTCVAESYAKDDEEMVDVTIISQKEFQNWLFKGKEFLDINGEKIPTAYILRVFIAMDQPGPTPEQRKGKYGDLSLYKELLEKEDSTLLHQIESSYYASQPEADIVRIAPDVDMEALRPVTKLLVATGAIKDFYPPEEEKDEI